LIGDGKDLTCVGIEVHTPLFSPCCYLISYSFNKPVYFSIINKVTYWSVRWKCL